MAITRNCVEARHVVKKIQTIQQMNATTASKVKTEEDHPAYAKICEKWKKDKEILIIKHKQNSPYQEARKIIEVQFSKSSNAAVAKENLEKEHQQAKQKIRNTNTENSNNGSWWLAQICQRPQIYFTAYNNTNNWLYSRN